MVFRRVTLTNLKMFLISNLVVLIFAVLVQCDELIVNTNYGKVKGEQLTTLLGKKPYFSFKGIPYAEPPVGNFRFKPAERPKPWSTVRDAIRFGNACVQGHFVDQSKFLGDEDCLFINVYTPDLNPKEKLPVVFGVHGGAFFYGNGEMFGPDFLIDQNVILVTMNYRLGPLGFLSLGTPEYSGNMGLKDQNLALKWTNENIQYFGGNKDLITIIGESAGGASIHYHMLSPLSKGLFKRAVVMCGSALNPWAFNYHRDHIQVLKDLGVRVNNPFDDNVDIIEFLKQVDASFLTRHTLQQFVQLGLPRQNIAMIWSPIVEHPDTKNPFLQDTPETILHGDYVSNVDSLFTYASNEMLMISPLVTDEMTAKLNPTMEIHLPLAEANISYKSEAYKEIATKIRKHYFNDDGTVSGSDKEKYIKLLSDIYFAYGIHKAAQLQALKSKGKTYNWIYSGTPSVGGSHTDDSSHIFLRNSDWILKSVYEDFNEEAVNVINTLSSFVAEFARSGNPTPNQRPVDFKPITSDAHYFLNITRHELILSEDPMSKAFAFWDNIFATYFGQLGKAASHEL